MRVFISAAYGAGAPPNITKTGYSEPHLQSWMGRGDDLREILPSIWTRTLRGLLLQIPRWTL